MSGKNIEVATTQKDWDDFFAGWNDPQNEIDPLDSYTERVRMACELSGSKIKEAIKRLDEPKKEKVRVTVEFEFDR
jgi:hypothetical protein